MSEEFQYISRNDTQSPGLEETLHRISAIVNEQTIVGFTYRIGRHVPGVSYLSAERLVFSEWRSD